MKFKRLCLYFDPRLWNLLGERAAARYHPGKIVTGKTLDMEVQRYSKMVLERLAEAEAKGA